MRNINISLGGSAFITFKIAYTWPSVSNPPKYVGDSFLSYAKYSNYFNISSLFSLIIKSYALQLIPVNILIASG